jgi:hypothetical protein
VRAAGGVVAVGDEHRVADEVDGRVVKLGLEVPPRAACSRATSSHRRWRERRRSGLARGTGLRSLRSGGRLRSPSGTDASGRGGFHPRDHDGDALSVVFSPLGPAWPSAATSRLRGRRLPRFLSVRRRCAEVGGHPDD